MRKFLLLFCLALPVGADSQRLYRGSLGPTETFSLALGDDHTAQLSFVEDKILSKASGHYTWSKNRLVVKLENGGPFVLEIRRKGVDTPPPRLEIKAGKEVQWQTELEGDRLVLKAAGGWEMPLHRVQQP
ncbi:hypothetical protein JST97_23420 [bacterium]|nr:hypothetical protein [bacterium]